MSKKKAKKKTQEPIKKLQAMVREDNGYICCRFEFDSDGRGVKWQHGMRCGAGETVEKFARHFESMGYTVVEWSVK